TYESLRAPLARLGDLPFTLRHLTAEALDPVMIPKSLLNELRRKAAEQLAQLRTQSREIQIADSDALNTLRGRIEPATGRNGERATSPVAGSPPRPVADSSSSVCILTRSLDQLLAVTTWKRTAPIAT